MTNLWDVVFGTLDRPDKVKVPARLAPVWLVDDQGVMHSEFAEDYVIVGRRTRPWEARSDDHDRAYANLAPIAEVGA
jgi:hypothetical protein